MIGTLHHVVQMTRTLSKAFCSEMFHKALRNFHALSLINIINDDYQGCTVEATCSLHLEMFILCYLIRRTETDKIKKINKEIKKWI